MTDIPQISVSNALRKWRMQPETTIDCDGFKAVVRFFGGSNQLVHAEVAKRQNATALSGLTTPDALNDEDFRQDVEGWCRISLVSWDMMGDPVLDEESGEVIQEAQPVPIELAPDIFCSHGPGGKELYFAMFQASRERHRFVLGDENLETTAKN